MVMVVLNVHRKVEGVKHPHLVPRFSRGKVWFDVLIKFVHDGMEGIGIAFKQLLKLLLT